MLLEKCLISYRATGGNIRPTGVVDLAHTAMNTHQDCHHE